MDKKKTKVNKNFTKLTHKGVSLIVLIVTIIVIVILAATVILTLSKNNPIESAREARFKEDIRMFQDELNMYIASEYTKLQGQRDEKITALEYTEKGDKNSVYTYLSSFTKKYENKIGIKEDEIVYVGFDEKEREWLINSGIYMAKKITVHYKDGYGNSLKESEEYPMLDVKYHFEAPEIEGYMALNEVEEGITSGDKEITFEYCMISNDLAFIGLDSSGKETSVESDIVSYTVSGIGQCNNPYVAIPREHNGKSVTQIKSKAFNENNIIKKIVVPNTVDVIEVNAFNFCNSLLNVKLNSKTIRRAAFRQCTNLEKVELGSNVKKVESYGFETCSKLSDFTIYSEDISFNGNNIFIGCNLLKEIKVNENNKSYISKDGILYTKDKKKIIKSPPGREGNVDIPKETEEICYAAFEYNNNLTELNIPDTVDVIEVNAFDFCKSLLNVKLNSKAIKTAAFRQCTNLEKVELGSNVKKIESYGFEMCSKLSDFTIYSEDISFNGNNIFIGCNLLKEIKVNENNKSYISKDGILYTKDKKKIIKSPPGREGNVDIPKETEEISYASFENNNNLTELNIPDTVDVIEVNAFDFCKNLLNVKLNSKTIRRAAFRQCTNLEKVELGSNVKKVESYGFEMCSKLSDFTIYSEDISFNGNNIFIGCKNLNNIIYESTMEMWNNISKTSVWNNGSSITKVICTDGDIQL